MMSDAPTGTVTFLLSDIAGSTALWEAYPAEMDGALRAHDRILRETVDRHDGMVVKHTGDGVCAAFDRASSAAEAALDSLLAFDAERWPEPVPLHVRIVLHTGECFEREHDYFGPPLCVATRLIERTPAGEIWATGVTVDLLFDAYHDRIEAVLVGIRHLRGVSRPIKVFRLARFDPSLAATT